ncbi:MAG: MarR family transcriptional regulator [Deltaproteobacteria bacterium]|jgi:DNA-binding MarR family transcriptional regulator|nr:MarR family transcriptional regulator [Deltaproteobacteria bacterium]
MEDIYFRLLYEMIRLGNYHNQYSVHKRKYGTDEDYYENEVHILAELVRDNSITLMELAKKFFKTKSYISQVITQLEKRELIVKDRSAEDARKRVYKVTPKGLHLDKLHHEYDFAQSRLLPELFKEFSQEDLDLFMRMLEKYHQFQLADPRWGTDAR